MSDRRHVRNRSSAIHVNDDELVHMDMRQMIRSNNILTDKVIFTANLLLVQSPMKYPPIMLKYFTP